MAAVGPSSCDPPYSDDLEESQDAALQQSPDVPNTTGEEAECDSFRDTDADELCSLATEDTWYRGVVKRLIAETPTHKAHGFVSCDEMYRLYGRDVFLHDVLSKSLVVGQSVTFQVCVNGCGMPQAVDLWLDDTRANELDYQVCHDSKAYNRAAKLDNPPVAGQPPSVERLVKLLEPYVRDTLPLGPHISAAAFFQSAEMLGLGDSIRKQVLMELSSRDVDAPSDADAVCSSGEARERQRSKTDGDLPYVHTNAQVLGPVQQVRSDPTGSSTVPIIPIRRNRGTTR